MAETKLPEVIAEAIETISNHLDDCNDVGEAMTIKEKLEELAEEFDTKSDELAEAEADDLLGGLAGD